MKMHTRKRMGEHREKEAAMTKPTESADECFDIYLTEMGIGIKERRLIISYASKCAREACEKQREMIADRYFNNYGQVTTRRLRDKIVEFILNTPEPKS